MAGGAGRAAAFLLTALLLCLPCGAQSRGKPLDSSSSPAFRQVCGALSARPVQKGEFTQTKHIARLNRDLVSNGRYVIAGRGTGADGKSTAGAGAASGGILWQTEKPFASTMAVTETGIVQTSASGRKTSLDASGNATFRELSTVIASVFQGDADLLIEHFTVYFEMNPAGSWQVTLEPKDSTLSAVIADITMSGSFTAGTAGAAGANSQGAGSAAADQALIHRITMQEKSGDSVRYEFAKQAFSDTLTPDEKAYF